MPVRNQSVHRQPQVKTILGRDFISVTRAVAADNAISSFTAGNDQLLQVTTSEMGGVVMNTDGRLLRHLLDLRETAIDWSKPTLWRVLWCGGSTDVADTVLFRLRYGRVTYNTSAITLVTTTALSTIIPQDTVPTAVAFTLNATGYGIINADTLQPDASTPVTALSLEMTMQTKDGDFAEALSFIGLQIGYLPRHFSDANATNVNADTAAEIGTALSWSAT